MIVLNTTEIQVVPNYLPDHARGLVESQGYSKQEWKSGSGNWGRERLTLSISCRLLHANVHLTNIKKIGDGIIGSVHRATHVVMMGMGQPGGARRRARRAVHEMMGEEVGREEPLSEQV